MRTPVEDAQAPFLRCVWPIALATRGPATSVSPSPLQDLGLLERRRSSLRRARRSPGLYVPLVRARPGAAAPYPSRGAQLRLPMQKTLGRLRTVMSPDELRSSPGWPLIGRGPR